MPHSTAHARVTQVLKRIALGLAVLGILGIGLCGSGALVHADQQHWVATAGIAGLIAITLSAGGLLLIGIIAIVFTVVRRGRRS